MADEVNEDVVINTARSFGFILESQVSDKLQQRGYSIESNRIFPHVGEEGCQEVDIIATNVENKHIRLVIECKGAKGGTELILIKAPSDLYSNECNLFGKNEFFELNDRWNLALFELKEDKYTFTGDFCGPNKKDEILTQSNSNFYKAQQQIIKSVALCSDAEIDRIGDENDSDYYDQRFGIVPIIVTNAQIWVLEYEGANIKASKSNFAIHRVIDASNVLNLSFRNADVTVGLSVPILVVNIEGLEECIQSLPNALKYPYQSEFKKIQIPN